jgi:hypothetical protein
MRDRIGPGPGWLLQLSSRLQGRTFGAPGLTALAVNSETGTSRRGGRAARVTRRRRPEFNLGSRRCGAAAFAASFGREPYGAAAAAHSIPGYRPPAVPAVSRCRARQYHGQEVTLAPGAPGAVKDVTATRAERRALSGLASPASTVLRIPLRGTRLRRAVDPGDLYQPSGPDGEGQATGQALKARGEPLVFRQVQARDRDTRPGNDEDYLTPDVAPCGVWTGR